MPLAIVFTTCRPREDVLQGSIRDDEFAADLYQVVTGTATKDYLDPALFFAKTYSTRGLRELLKAVCLRLSAKGGEVSPILRLGTQYGGGKTHSLVALVHAARGMKGVENVADFVDPSILPTGAVRIAALDGENADPANGLTLEPSLRAHSLWGEMAYRLAGRTGFERVRVSDEKHVAPGAETIRELFGNEPTLILLDEISVYLRKVERTFPDASKQFAAFVHDLFKAVSSTPKVALVYTLAIGKDSEGSDAYKAENERAAAAMAEAESVAVRSTTALNPTEEDETANVLRTRLFESVDQHAAKEAVAAYASIWNANQDGLPDDATSAELKEAFIRSYPLHPKLLEMFMEKTASLSTFQRTRGMLRILARTVHYLWRAKPSDAYAIHTHHLDPAAEKIRTEINVKLGQGQYAPAVIADVAAVAGNEPALAQRIDQQRYPGMPPITSYVARTIYWHTLAYGDAARGVTPEQLKLSVCGPQIEPAFIEQARTQFVTESIYLDDRPGAPLRFMVEPNLTMIIRRKMNEIDPDEARTELRERIRGLFSLTGRGEFNTIIFPSSPYDVPDELGDGRPILAVMGHESTPVPTPVTAPPPDVADIFEHHGNQGKPRELKNNLVFVAPDERSIPNMRDQMRRYLALHALHHGGKETEVADHQRQKVQSELKTAIHTVAMSILQCYRHLFYPSNSPMAGTSLPLGHTMIELSNPGESPGNGQHQVVHVLHEQRKLLTAADAPEAPGFVLQQVGLRSRGEMTTAQIELEYRRAPKLSILLQPTPLLQCIRNGVAQSIFIYREGTQVWGVGDPGFGGQISNDSFLHTMEDAKAKKLWPRAEPLRVSFRSAPTTIDPGQQATLEVTIEGGVAPFRISASEKLLNTAETSDSVHRVSVAPTQSMSYAVEVTDSRGQVQKQTTTLAVRVPGSEQLPLPPPAPEAKPPAEPALPSEVSAEGPLPQALEALWEKARKAKFPAIGQLTVKLFDPSVTWKVHTAIATMNDADVTCEYEVEIESEGMETFQLAFKGKMEKANAVKSFLDTQIRTADDSDLKATYTLVFKTPLSIREGATEQLKKRLTQYGGGEAYVMAQAGKA